MKRRRQKEQTYNNRESDGGGEGDYGTIPTFSGGEKKDHDKTSKKVTVSLALDELVVEEIRKQADKSQVSFNARVNTILEKYVKFFMLAEQDRVAIIHPSTHQFFLNEIDEAKYTAELKRLATETIDGIFTQTGIRPTLDNMIKHVFENICVNGGSIRTVKKYFDEDRRLCLFFMHDYDLKWSRILSAAFAHHIQSLFHYHITIKVFSKGFEIKILERDPATA